MRLQHVALRRTKLGVGLVAIGVAAAVSVPAAHADSAVAESFSGDSVASDVWRAGGDACLSAAVGIGGQIEGCGVDLPGEGVMRLTSAYPNQSGFLLHNLAVQRANGLDIFFLAAQWGYIQDEASAGDGLSFFLVDGETNLTEPGSPGGSLGYSARGVGAGATPGVAGGLLGVGLDSYGNFSEGNHEGTGCGDTAPGQSQNSIALRGPGDGLEGYCFLGGRPLDDEVTSLSGEDRSDSHLFRIRIDPVNVDVPMVRVYVDNIEVLELALPSIFETVDEVKFGWSASTGGALNNHEIWGASIFSEVLPEDYEYVAPTFVGPSLPATGGSQTQALVWLFVCLCGGGCLISAVVRRFSQR